MSPDELIYLSLLVLSIPLGYLVRQVRDHTWRRAVVFAVGAGQVLLTCRWDSLHSLVSILGTFTILKTAGPRTCHLLTFVWCFGYLAFFRTCHLFHLPYPAAVANAVQLVLTLKLSSVAFDIRDSHVAEKSRKDGNDNSANNRTSEETKNKPTEQALLPVPSLTDLFCYSYCYIGVYTGPFYKYRTYQDFIYQEKPSSVPVLQPLLDRAKWMPLTGGVFLLASRYFPIAYAHTEEFYATSGVPYRLWYMLGMFLVFRMRMYSAWILAECSCITAGMGAYEEWRKPKCGQGPTVRGTPEPGGNKSPQETRYNFDTIKNVDIYWVERGTTIRSGMKHWNMTVQYWMAEYIYRRVPYKSFRFPVVFVVSAYWHGIHGGYYLFFLSVALMQIVEFKCDAAFKSRLTPDSTTANVYGFVSWFLKYRAGEYYTMAFLLLTIADGLRCWQSVYFYTHVLHLLLLALAYIVGSGGHREKNKEKMK